MKLLNFIAAAGFMAMSLLASSGSATAQKIKATKSNIEIEADTTASDSTPKTKGKSYKELLRGAKSTKGLFTVHTKGKDHYFEIHDSLMGRDMLLVNKISSVTYEVNDAGINKGMGFGDKCIRLSKDTTHNKIWVSTFDYRASVPEGDAIARSVKDNYRDAIIEQFTIEAYNADSTTVLIKANKVFDGSEKSFNNVFNDIGLMSSAKRDLSKIESIKAFPENIVVRSMLSTLVTEGQASVPVTVDITSNIVLLSRVPMTPRFSDNRIGYFTTPKLYFSDAQQKVDEQELITRWRLEPKPEDRARYLSGELVEPQKPILFYVDPATPPQWVPYIIEGVNQWQEAFEQAGFKNAIKAIEVDPNDKDFDLDDVRYSVITYAASESANAMGPSVIDPRSGEIIEADIIWWHNVMTVLQLWTRIQTSTVNPAAQGNVLPRELMGNGIQFVSSHELGHSLGLKHNFGASWSVPVDSLRSKTYTDTHGTASSIMDYARFNYVAQPGDGITELTPIIGTYDKHAIQWGYRWLDAQTPHQEVLELNNMLRAVESDPSCWYGEQSAERIDPRAQSEDLGDDAVKASRLGIANLKLIAPNIVDWTDEEGKLQFEAGRLLMATVFQWNAFAGHVMTNVGGYMIDNIVAGQSGSRYTPVPAAKQREAVQYLLEEAFTYPEWLFGASAWRTSYARRSSPIGQIEYSPLTMFRNQQYGLFYSLLNDERLARMYEAELALGRNNAYTPEEMVGSITNVIFGKAPRTLSVTQRATQKNYVDALIVSSNITMLKTTKMGSALHDKGCCLMHATPEIDVDKQLPRPEDLTDIRTSRNFYMMQRVSDVASVKRAEMERILRIAQRRTSSGDIATSNHYGDLVIRLREALRKL